MEEPFSSFQLPAVELKGQRIWLSGAVPEDSGPGAKEIEKGILGFVESLALHVFRSGGHIVHGSNPSFVPVLLKVAKQMGFRSRVSKPLTLIVSEFWRSGENYSTWEELKKIAHVVETKVGYREGKPDREESLRILRFELSRDANSFVAVGGKHWYHDQSKAGVPAELKLAMEKKLPAYIVAGFGGAVSEYMDANRELFQHLNNGLSFEKAEELANSKDITVCASLICAYLSDLNLREREARLRARESEVNPRPEVTKALEEARLESKNNPAEGEANRAEMQSRIKKESRQLIALQSKLAELNDTKEQKEKEIESLVNLTSIGHDITGQIPILEQIIGELEEPGAENAPASPIQITARRDREGVIEFYKGNGPGAELVGDIKGVGVNSQGEQFVFKWKAENFSIHEREHLPVMKKKCFESAVAALTNYTREEALELGKDPNVAPAFEIKIAKQPSLDFYFYCKIGFHVKEPGPDGFRILRFDAKIGKE